jgi:hypothetical protein
MDMLQTVAQWRSSVKIAEPDMDRRRGRMAAQQPGPSPRRQPAGITMARPVALDAFRLARRTFQAGDRVDMQTLARTLHVDRVTVYRWVGSRAGLPAGSGPSPAAAVVTGTVRAVIANPGMQRFIDREGDLALRLLTTKASGFEARLVAVIADLVRQEAEAGRLTAVIPADDLPYVLVRIMESYVYLGLITGEHPDPDRAARVINALLPG